MRRTLPILVKKKFDYYQFSTLRIEKNIYQVYQNVLKLEKGAINNQQTSVNIFQTEIIQYQVLSVQYKPISVAEDKKCYDSSKKWHLFQISAHCTSLFKGELVRFWHFSIRSFRVHVSYQTFYFQRLTLRSSVMQPNMWSIKVL